MDAGVRITEGPQCTFNVGYSCCYCACFRAEQNGRRQGYMGHLVRISNGLVRFGETDEQVSISEVQAPYQFVIQDVISISLPIFFHPLPLLLSLPSSLFLLFPSCLLSLPLPLPPSLQLTTSLDDDTQQKWNNFVNGPLAEMNKRNETNLVSSAV